MLAVQVSKSTLLRYSNASATCIAPVRSALSTRQCVCRSTMLPSTSAAVSRHFMSSMTVERPAEEKHFALILGKPGGGKGTISGKILKDFPQFHHVSSGDLLRSHVRDGTNLGVKAKQYMESGKLVPDNLMIDLVMEEATPHLDNGKSLLLDGFPRTVTQAQALEKEVHVDMVINLDIPTETIVERIADRWIHEPSGRIYSYSYKPPKVHGKDDVTGEPLVQRKDDQPETVRARLQQYDDVTSPLVDYYEGNGVLKTFRGTKSDVIYPEVRAWLEETFLEQ
ncbi:adenylate kinase-domain containing protein [Nitzschia inconspicua]|uniref:GTP:AMP phosphotransferase, mitochondrial n=1 Tax=Nitzschia inconspicua TaxID=303405 RepID=A0A9K3L130_9STRA|nr:adenylate kinase-domain containing protein [Nitzschia inconspicua]